MPNPARPIPLLPPLLVVVVVAGKKKKEEEEEAILVSSSVLLPLNTRPEAQRQRQRQLLQGVRPTIFEEGLLLALSHPAQESRRLAAGGGDD